MGKLKQTTQRRKTVTETSLSTKGFVGAEIRELRKATGLTLKKVSSLTGISFSYLGAIERGEASPSVDAIEAISKALNVDVSWFFPTREGASQLEQACVVRRNARRNLNSIYGKTADELGFSDSLLSSSIGGGFILGTTHFDPDKSIERGWTATQPEGECHGIVFEGELELTLVEDVINLQAGDSYTIPNALKHRIRNVTNKSATLVWAVSPVILVSK